MSKQIIIVGGGISGLTALHHLRQKYPSRSDVTIKLFEKEATPGGPIRTVRKNGFQYEGGPNGFLDSQPSTMELVEELGLTGQLITANPTTKIRYICLNDHLHALPTSPLSFLLYPLLSISEKFRVLKEITVPQGTDPDETVYEFGTRRFGEKFTKLFLDPMVSGIFGGNSRELNFKFSFPRVYEIEQKYGSLFKGKFRVRPMKGHLRSFKNGMGQIVEGLAARYNNSIICGKAVTKIIQEETGYLVQVAGEQYFADELILSVPAYAAAEILGDLDRALADRLKAIEYASISIAGLVYSSEQFSNVPQGFGYLRPSEENKEILGVLFSSQIYPQRSHADNYLFQVMLGGANHPETVTKSEDELLTLAKNEIRDVLGAQGEPQDLFLQRWNKAIPQYNRSYPGIYTVIQESLGHHPHLHLLANYLDGIAVNDCTANAKKLCEKL